MGYLYQDVLRVRAIRFIDMLKRAGITGSIIEDSFRDYSVKVEVAVGDREYGHVNIYFKPSKDSFTLRMHELRDKAIAPQLEGCWEEKSRSSEAPARGWQMYVDGSYSDGATGYGVVILKDGGVIAELSGPVPETEVNGTYQVAGELKAVLEGLAWCRQNGVVDIEVFYDYFGVEKWATGAWRANQPLTREYGEQVRNAGVRIRWHKVAAHSGNRWNDRADLLAKRGARPAESGASGVPAHAGLAEELLEKKDRFLDFLMINGVEATFDNILNGQFARLLILDENEKTLGYFDLYHTRRKPFSPYLHGFKDAELKNRIADLWRQFAAG